MRLRAEKVVVSFLFVYCLLVALSDGTKSIKNHVETLDTREIQSGSYSLLSIDEKYNHLLVGAKDNAFLVDLDNIKNLKSWTLSKTDACDFRQVHQCHNVMKIMLPFKERILLCWSGATRSSSCAWRNRKDLKGASSNDTKGNSYRTDFDYLSTPDQNDTAIITEHGIIFSGTIHPYYKKAIINSRTLTRHYQHNVSTSLVFHRDFYTDVHFVKSFSVGHYVFFFFRERSLEFEDTSNEKVKISRVARICKGDFGGQTLLENEMVTFQRATLTCSDGGIFPFFLNEIQDVWWDEQTNLFYAVFISHPNGPPSSAICVYHLSDINHVFDKSPFKWHTGPNNPYIGTQWVITENYHKKHFKDCKVNPKDFDFFLKTAQVPHGMMATRKMKIALYITMAHDHLMLDPVQPKSYNAHSEQVSRAWFIKDGIRMTAVALDKVGAHTVLYTSTDRGSVLKISKPAGVNHSCLLTELDIFPSNKREVIKAMAIDTTRHVLYLGSNTTLTKLHLEQCSNHVHQSSCISTADPYCAWDKERRQCVSILSHRDPKMLKQNLTTCPQLTEKWSAWKTCVQSDGNYCRCQARPCQTSSCQGGYEFRLKNCTVDVNVGWEGTEAWETFGVQHGGWSAWGNWSKCPEEAWAGVKHRKRTCTNPVPKRGGKTCVGESIKYKPCKGKKVHGLLKANGSSPSQAVKTWNLLLITLSTVLVLIPCMI